MKAADNEASVTPRSRLTAAAVGDAAMGGMCFVRGTSVTLTCSRPPTETGDGAERTAHAGCECEHN